MCEKVKVLIAGFGFMGQTHCGSLLKDPEAEVCGIIDPFDPAERLSSIKGNQQTVTITADDVRNIPHYTTLEEAFAKAQADAVVIALPTKFHTQAVMMALDAGMHVFVEKPFALSAEDCRMMTDSAAEKNLRLAVGYVVRSMAPYRYLHNTVKSGVMGKLKLLRLTRETGQPSWGNWSDPEFVKASGGALFDMLSHDFDFARYCLGEPEKITAVKELCGNFNGNLLTAVLDFGDGQAVVSGGFVQPSSYPFFSGFSAFFENGSLIGDCTGMLKAAGNDGRVETVELPGNDPYYDELRAFISSVKNGTDSIVCSGADAAKTIGVCCEVAKQIGEINK